MFGILELASPDDFNQEKLNGLLDGSISCIVLPSFYKRKDCKKLVEFVNDNIHRFENYKSINASVLGNPLYWENRPISDYLTRAKKWQDEMSAAYQEMNLENPVEMVFRLFKKITGRPVCRVENDGRQFFAGDIRIIRSAGLHTDVVTRRIKEGQLGNIREQLSWNVYLTESPRELGALQIFDKVFEPTDSDHKKKRGFGYRKTVVKGRNSVKIYPCAGNLVIFKSTNYHLVQQADPSVPRITVTSFIGYSGPNEPVIFWS